ncbi:hypothetical protein [Bacillus thuringiensis]|uniref:hypothetical protein n=1 Tax=Bacillus thuringiensis TaxID=1428 RepID=UPI001C556670|nr:hypothetical protein [Bacillus thuringiensis]
MLQLEQLGKPLYIKGNQVIALILIVMAMELHVKNSNKKEASFLLTQNITTYYFPPYFNNILLIILKNDTE